MKFTVFTPKTKPLLGIDIGTTFIKAVLLVPAAHNWECHGVACELILGDAFTERDIHNFEPIANALKHIMRTLHIKQHKAVIAIAGNAVLSKIIQMPNDLDELQLEEQIEIEADSLIPYPLNEVYWDFTRIGESQHVPHQADILLTAAHKSLIDSRITLAREAGMHPDIVETEACALQRVILTHTSTVQSMLTLVHIGSELMHIVVAESHQVVYCKEHTVGLASLFQGMASELHIDPKAILQQLSAGNTPSGWHHQLLPAVIAQLQLHIGRAIQLCTLSHHLATPTHISLSGGVASLPDLIDPLSRAMNINFSLFNPLQRIAIKTTVNAELISQLLPQLCIATGLALRSEI